jgi:hypothetical protein
VTPYALVDIYFSKKTAASMINDVGDRTFFGKNAKYSPGHKLLHPRRQLCLSSPLGAFGS